MLNHCSFVFLFFVLAFKILIVRNPTIVMVLKGKMKKMTGFSRILLFALICSGSMFVAGANAGTLGTNQLEVSSFSGSFDGSPSAYVNLGTSSGNFGTSDFTIKFLIQTNSTSLQSVISKRSICGHQNFWDILMDSAGNLFFAIDQDSNATNYHFFRGNKIVNDGNIHKVAISRRGYQLSIKIDNDPTLWSSLTTTDITNINNDYALIVGRSVCTGIDGTQPFVGWFSDLEISSGDGIL